MVEQSGSEDRNSWAGPGLFIAVLILLAVFFWWFVRA